MTPFSVRASERAAVQLAKKIAPLFKGIGILRSDNCAELVGRLVSLTGLPTIRIQAMLSHLMPLRIDNMALFRLSLAIVEYLPLFDKDDNSYDGAYRGNPPVWTHVRVLSARALNGGVSRTVQLVLLPMTSVLAGRLITMRISVKQALELVKKCGCHRRGSDIPPAPQELTSTYHYMKIGASNGMLAIYSAEWEPSEKEENKKLATMRRQRMCNQPEHIKCIDCCAGRDKCPAACRATTRRRENDMERNDQQQH